MSKTAKNLTYIVTEEEYQAELAQGLTEYEVMKPGTYKIRRSPWAGKLKNTNKVKVSMYLDEVVVEYFRARAVSNANQQRTAPHYGKRRARKQNLGKRHSQQRRIFAGFKGKTRNCLNFIFYEICLDNNFYGNSKRTFKFFWFW